MTNTAPLWRIIPPDAGPVLLATDPSHSVWVNASAGSGKTNILTQRVLSLLLHGTPAHKILCLTYTKAAAAEMASRIQSKLAAWVHMDNRELQSALSAIIPAGDIDDAMIIRARRLFAVCLDVPDGLKIQTLHSFCQSLLNRFPIEAGIIPNFRICEDREAGILLQQSIDRAISQDSAIKSAVMHLTALWRDQENFATLIKKLLAKQHWIQSALQRHNNVDGIIRAAAKQFGFDDLITPDMIISTAVQEAAFDRPGLLECCVILDQGSSAESKRAQELRKWISADPSSRKNALDDYTAIFLTQEDEIKATKNLFTAKSRDRFPAIEAIMMTEAQRIRKTRQDIMAARLLQTTHAALTVAQSILTDFAARKMRAGVLDYQDLISRSVELLQKPGISPWVLFKLDGGIDHILIDEAQDTSPEQWQIVRSLTSEFFAGDSGKSASSTIFAVGDPKQSIYSFQNADPRGFIDMQKYFAKSAFDSRQELRVVPLMHSYRSTAAILQLVDSVFCYTEAKFGVSIFSKREEQEKIASHESLIQHFAKRQNAPGLIEIWPFVPGLKSEDSQPWEIPNHKSRAKGAQQKLAIAIADQIAQWLRNGETIASNHYTKRPSRAINAGDIMILVRKRGPIVGDITRALKSRGIPVAGIDRMVLSDHIAIMDLIALGKFLLLPDDDLNLAALLKSPLIAWPIDSAEELLFKLAHDRGEQSVWQSLQARQSEHPEFSRAYAYLHDLWNMVDIIKPFELFSHVLDVLCGRSAFLARLGHECLDPIDEFLNLCLAASDHTQNMQEFIEWFESGKTEIKRDMDNGDRNEVRIMTIHASKGLQAPIVFLPDTQTPPRANNDLLFDEQQQILLWPSQAALKIGYAETIDGASQEKQIQEYRRLLYVAMTRAEDRLYIACAGEPHESGWYQYAFNAARHMQSMAEAKSVEFDFSHLGFEDWRGMGWRIGDMVIENIAPAQKPQSASTALTPPPWLHKPWQQEAPDLRPLRPSRPDYAEPTTMSPLAKTADAPSQSRLRGQVIHRLLQSIPSIPHESQPVSIARFLSPIEGIDDREKSVIASEVLQLIRHPQFGDYFGPDSRAEIPVTGIVGHKIIRGQIDRIIISDRTVKILDFKTNRPIPDTIEQIPPAYLAQMAAYQMLLQRAYPHKNVECALLWTNQPLLTPLSDDILRPFRP